MKKCGHNNLKIWRILNLHHVTEVSVSVNEDNYHETTVDYEDSNEWNITDVSKISVSCCLCGKEWNEKKVKNFPKWLQEVLYQEEKHFKEL